MINRFFPVAALVLSIVAVLITALLWREVHLLRAEAAQQSIHYRLTDEQFAVVKGWRDYVHKTFEEGHLPRGEVLLADQLLNKARFMHGDISREEWHRLTMQAEPDFPELLIRRVQAGAGSSADIMNHYDDLFESSR